MIADELICPHGNTPGACLRCRQTAKPPSMNGLCPHCYANPANCPDCTRTRTRPRRRRLTLTPATYDPTDCAYCGRSPAGHDAAEALVDADARHPYRPRKGMNTV